MSKKIPPGGKKIGGLLRIGEKETTHGAHLLLEELALRGEVPAFSLGKEEGPKEIPMEGEKDLLPQGFHAEKIT